MIQNIRWIFEYLFGDMADFLQGKRKESLRNQARSRTKEMARFIIETQGKKCDPEKTGWVGQNHTSYFVYEGKALKILETVPWFDKQRNYQIEYEGEVVAHILGDVVNIFRFGSWFHDFNALYKRLYDSRFGDIE